MDWMTPEELEPHRALFETWTWLSPGQRAALLRHSLPHPRRQTDAQVARGCSRRLEIHYQTKYNGPLLWTFRSSP